MAVKKRTQVLRKNKGGGGLKSMVVRAHTYAPPLRAINPIPKWGVPLS